MSNMLFETKGQELVMERVFDAPRELVFAAFTEAEHLKNWWGPRGWELTACNIDFREGGAWHYCMKCMDQNQGDFYGMESWGKAVFHEIVAGEKFVYTDYFSDADGNVSEGMPAALSTVLFEEVDGKTKVTSLVKYPTEEELKKVLEMGMQQGITETWDRLGEHLQSVQAVR